MVDKLPTSTGDRRISEPSTGALVQICENFRRLGTNLTKTHPDNRTCQAMKAAKKKCQVAVSGATDGDLSERDLKTHVWSATRRCKSCGIFGRGSGPRLATRNMWHKSLNLSSNPSKIEWDLIPTDPGPSKLRLFAIRYLKVFSGSFLTWVQPLVRFLGSNHKRHEEFLWRTTCCTVCTWTFHRIHSILEGCLNLPTWKHFWSKGWRKWLERWIQDFTSCQQGAGGSTGNTGKIEFETPFPALKCVRCCQICQSVTGALIESTRFQKPYTTSLSVVHEISNSESAASNDLHICHHVPVACIFTILYIYIPCASKTYCE